MTVGTTETRIATQDVIAQNSYLGGLITVARAGETFTVQYLDYGTRVIRGHYHGFLLPEWSGFATSVVAQ